MTQKYHNPMKTITEQVSHRWGYETVTRKEARTNRMDYLSEQLMRLNEQMCQEAEGRTDAEIEEIMKTFVKKCKPLFAESDADFLIANNIARRGKPLHANIALMKLAKMRGSMRAKTVGWAIEESIFPDLSLFETHEQNLHYFLKTKYGVTLMDKTAYSYCQSMINMYNQPAFYNKRKLEHWQNFAKKFHASIKDAKQK